LKEISEFASNLAAPAVASWSCLAENQSAPADPGLYETAYDFMMVSRQIISPRPYNSPFASYL
jgi:hypothetical protein